MQESNKNKTFPPDPLLIFQHCTTSKAHNWQQDPLRWKRKKWLDEGKREVKWSLHFWSEEKQTRYEKCLAVTQQAAEFVVLQIKPRKKTPLVWLTS